MSLKDQIFNAFQHSVDAVRPNILFNNRMRIDNELLSILDISDCSHQINISKFENFYLIGAGKASAAMAQALELKLSSGIKDGYVVTKYGFGTRLELTKLLEAGHPIPDENSISAGLKITECISKANSEDLVLMMLSGGASALLEMPRQNILLEDIINLSKLLLDCGADIKEINIVRRAVSSIKGGNLLEYAFPAKVISFIISDVVGNDLASIGSGPTVLFDDSTLSAHDVIAKYGLVEKLSPKVLEIIWSNKLKASKNCADAENIIIADNSSALKAAENFLKQAGYETVNLGTVIEGEARDTAKQYVRKLREIATQSNSKTAVISGGETTVTIEGTGLGGRNMEFALACAIELNPDENISILSGGTDGNDGPTDAAGAFVDGSTLSRASEKGLNAERYLQNNDSYNFFNVLGDLIITGPTRTNVMDIQIAILS